MRKILILVLSLFLVFSVVACSNDSGKESQEKDNNAVEVEEQEEEVEEEQEEAREADIAVSASEIFKEYVEDEASAEAKYQDKIVEIEGAILTRGEVAGAKFVTLLTEEGSTEGVQCFFEKEYEVDVAKDFKDNEVISVLGEIDKKRPTSLRVENCTLK